MPSLVLPDAGGALERIELEMEAIDGNWRRHVNCILGRVNEVRRHLVAPFRRSLKYLTSRLNQRTIGTSFFTHIVSLAAEQADWTPLAAPFVSPVVPVFDTHPRYLDQLVPRADCEPRSRHHGSNRDR